MKPFVKTLTYSLMHMSVAITVGYLITGNLAVAVGIGLIEPMVQTVFYHLHEAAWSRAGVAPTTVHEHSGLPS